MHDADGRIDREFDAFYDLLLPGGLVVIDDYQPATTAGSPRAVAKKMRTAALVGSFVEQGLIEPIEVVRNTLFARKLVAPRCPSSPRATDVVRSATPA